MSLVAAFGVELITPPVVEITPSDAIVHWRTDVACGTRAQVTPDSANVSIPDKTPAAEHTVIVTGLKPGTEFSIIVGSVRCV